MDIVQPSRRAALANVLQQRTQSPPVRTGNLAHVVVEALAHHDLHREALDRIREYWGGMLDRGATQFWEVFDPESPDGSLPQRLWSLSHAFCAGPAYALPAHFAGIRPLKPEFAAVVIQPRLADLSWMTAAVPTRKGTVRVRCFAAKGRGGSTHLECDLPADMEAQIIINTGARDIWSIWLNGVEVPFDRDRHNLRSDAASTFYPQMFEATLSRDSVELHFAKCGPPMAIHCEIRPEIGRAGRRIIVAEPGDTWDATPKPVSPD